MNPKWRDSYNAIQAKEALESAIRTSLTEFTTDSANVHIPKTLAEKLLESVKREISAHVLENEENEKDEDVHNLRDTDIEEVPSYWRKGDE